MTISISQDEQKASIVISDSLSIYDVAEYQKTLEKLLFNDIDITLDLETVTDVDSAGIQLLISLKKSVEAADSRFLISSIHEQMLSSLRLLNLESYLNMDKQEESNV